MIYYNCIYDVLTEFMAKRRRFKIKRWSYKISGVVHFVFESGLGSNMKNRGCCIFGCNLLRNLFFFLTILDINMGYLIGSGIYRLIFCSSRPSGYS